MAVSPFSGSLLFFHSMTRCKPRGCEERSCFSIGSTRIEISRCAFKFLVSGPLPELRNATAGGGGCWGCNRCTPAEMQREAEALQQPPAAMAGAAHLSKL
jgi:hypothetical protein